MSLYKRHKWLEKNVEWATTAKFSSPVVVVLKISGCSAVVETAGNGWWIVVASLITSIIGHYWHRSASRKLSKFIDAISTRPHLTRRYKRDAIIGQREETIATLRSQQTTLLMMASYSADNGNKLLAGYFFGKAKDMESRLREHGC